MFLKRFQLGLIHVAVAMTLVPINSTLNRVMIKELAILRDVVTQVTGPALSGYLIVFGIEAFMLFIAAIMLYQTDVKAFQKKAGEPSFVEKVALATE